MAAKKVPIPRIARLIHDSRGRAMRGMGVVMLESTGSVASL